MTRTLALTPRLLAVAFAAWIALGSNAFADRIILRNFEVLNNVKIESFDPDGIRMAGGKTLTWDQVEKGTVAKEKQVEFDKMLTALGDPLYRIRQRLSIGDYRGQLSFAEKLESTYAKRNSDPAYWVALGLMWGRLAEGRREAALAPYLRCMEIRRQRKDDPPNAPGDRRLSIESSTGLCSDLEPIWFDGESAKAELPKVIGAISLVKQPQPPAVRLYFASLAIAAGEPARAENALKTRLEGRAEDLRQVLLAQKMLAAGDTESANNALSELASRLKPETRPLAVYWLGVARTGAKDAGMRQRGLLDLLRLPANYGKEHPDLAGAGLHRAMEVLDKMGDASGGVRVRRELLQNYSQTYHAGLQKKTSPSTTEEKR